MRRLREDHAIYGTETGRINVAGLTAAQVGPLARALRQVATPARRASAA
jgi:aspartate aminotransferase